MWTMYSSIFLKMKVLVVSVLSSPQDLSPGMHSHLTFKNTAVNISEAFVETETLSAMIWNGNMIYGISSDVK